MPPIPIYTKSPISAAKASGVTPETEAPAPHAQQAQQAAPPSAADPGQGGQAYPAARPAAAPSIPEPTGSSQNIRYAPVQPTPTTKVEAQGPPPPQPGAVPVPPGAKSTLPPPPKAGEKFHAPETTQAPQLGMPYPPQMAVPPPAVPHAQRGTATATGSTSSGAFTGQLPGSLSRAEPGYSDPLAHPPGYQQNANPPAFSGYQQRASHEAQRAEDRRMSGDGDDEGVWNSAMRWAQTAGEKLSAAESEVWRRINKE